MADFISDKGIAFLSEREDGRFTVGVARSFDDGEPRDVYAVHEGVVTVDVDPSLELISSAAYRFSTQAVEVLSEDDGVVRIRPIRVDAQASILEGP